MNIFNRRTGTWALCGHRNFSSGLWKSEDIVCTADGGKRFADLSCIDSIVTDVDVMEVRLQCRASELVGCAAVMLLRSEHEICQVPKDLRALRKLLLVLVDTLLDAALLESNAVELFLCHLFGK
ncbi:hypothetical protein [Glutamicibacter arilaitensis]|uniref:hypothetical protein n=1 Tax=Glutamicibacter arilaitensis TaxID=256701 RepID=UPI003F954D6B